MPGEIEIGMSRPNPMTYFSARVWVTNAWILRRVWIKVPTMIRRQLVNVNWGES